jgi:hypothetical protein
VQHTSDFADASVRGANPDNLILLALIILTASSDVCGDMPLDITVTQARQFARFQIPAILIGNFCLLSTLLCELISETLQKQPQESKS